MEISARQTKTSTMGNVSNESKWATQKRLRWIEFLLWWRGWVGRADLQETFGISPAQASGDMQCYVEMNPEAMRYHTSRKRYESEEGMECRLTKPSFDDAVRVFFGGSEVAGERKPSRDHDHLWMASWHASINRTEPEVSRQYRRLRKGERQAEWVVDEGNSRLSVLSLPKRRMDEQVARRVVMAILSGRELQVRYASVHSGEDAWRVMVPRAVAWDGHRWHVRAWCRKREAWRDFVIGRIAEAAWPKDEAGELPEDVDWQTMETIRLRLHPSLSESQRAALRLDYGLRDDELVLRVRRAMKLYWLASMQVEDVSMTDEIPRHFILEKPDPELNLS